MDIKKKENESELAYMARLYRNKIELNLTNKEINEIINKELGSNYAESTTRCNSNSYNQGYNDGFEEALSKNSSEELLKEIEIKTKELEKEKIKFQDQKREYKNYLRMDARWEHIIDEMKIEINKLNTYNPIKNNDVCVYGDREATLILSDWHLGMINNSTHNIYNLEIAKSRLEYLYNKTIEYCKLHNVYRIHIELDGDFLHGNIHLSTRINAEEDVISQTIIVSEMLSDFIGKISNEINEVKVYGTLGNHSRISPNVKDSIDVENFERLITWYMRPRLINCKNVEIFDNFEGDIITYKVFNMNICAVHGHKEHYKQAITDLSKFMKVFFDELHLGHFHSSASFIDNDMETIVNGTFAGADEYAEGLRKSNKPSQTLIIYNKEGQECLYKIKL